MDVAAALAADKRPSWAAPALLLALWLAYHVVSWRVLGLTMGAWREALAGVALDVAVVAGFVLAGRIRGVAAIAGVATVLRVLDLGSCVMARSHVSPVVWWHLDPGAWRVAVEAGMPVLIGVAGGFGWLAARLVRRAAASRPPAFYGVAAPYTARIALALAVLLIADAGLAPRHAVHAGAMPGVDVPRSWLTFLGWRAPSEHRPPDAVALARWRRFGWITSAAAARAPRTSVRATGLGTASAVQRVEVQQPDVVARGVVLVLMESMNAGWSQVYYDKAPLPTPGLRRLAAQGVTIRGVLTQSRPTHNGIMASLCGLLPGTWPLDSARGRALPQLPDCLPHAVHAAGGATLFLQGSPLGFSGLDRTLQAMGFDRALGLEQLSAPGERGAQAPRGPWGLYDRDVFVAARQAIAALRRTARPFLVVVSTVDGHLPGSPDSTCPARGEPAPRAQACADMALLRFLTDLERDGVLSDVVIAVTADHAAPDLPEVRAAMPAGAAGSFAQIPLILAGPGLKRGERRTTGGQLDLPATLAARLGLEPLPGIDLLHATGAGRVRLSTMGRRSVGVATDSGRVEAALGEVERRCQRGLALGLRDESPGLACDVARFLHFLDSGWHRNDLTRLRGSGRTTRSASSGRATTH